MMKNISYFAVLFFLCSATSAQEDFFRDPSVKIENTVLMCKATSKTGYWVYDASNDSIQIRGIEGVQLLNIKFKSQKAIHHVFCEVFSSVRLKELSESDKLLRMLLFVNNKGELLKTEYSIPVNSKIKPSEIVKLDALMKQKFRFTTDEFERTENLILAVSQPIRYEIILKGEKIRTWDEWEYPSM